MNMSQQFMKKEWLLKAATTLSVVIADEIQSSPTLQPKDLLEKNIWYSPQYIEVIDTHHDDGARRHLWR